MPDQEPPPPSFEDYEDHPRGCSVSDFTESETSSYFSFSDDDEEEALKQSKEGGSSQQNLRNASNEETLLSASRDESESKAKNASKTESADISAAVLPRSTKPPIRASRARSAGLPPLNPNLLQQPSQDSSFVNRSRTDTGDFTRNSNFTRNSATTNNSRHRRNHDHFSFCSASISEICNNKDSSGKKQPPLPPPSVVSFQDRVDTGGSDAALAKPSALRMTDRGASDVSALGFGDSFDSCHVGGTETTHMYEDLLGLGYDEDAHGEDEDSTSPFAALKKGPKTSEMRNVAMPLQEHPEVSKELEYLRKSPSLDNAAEGSLVISGWVALLNLGTDTNAHQHHFYRIPSDHQFEADDIYYLRATKDSSGRASVRLRHSNGSKEHTLIVSGDWTIESREVNGRMGKAVILRTAKASLLLLPVSLNNHFFAQSGEFVCDADFDVLREELFVPAGQYAPDNQMDAAMYLMFTVDSLVKQCGSF